ncbi:stage III sporulation protein AF [Ruminiclostridium cellobioparum]|uniref:Stage III sporulation protein AF (Spore_III_AF) n=1 Tax=Ruminiclostridium cellobioparum subsp. termitidis CT1112 TaxID=1195236 RepID=S0FNI8_RUMCE|nr:stage III sporulation protein AF [Ruminiclostridium cellobioparum]EMS71916.1 Stage III sporulation protein AF (Spore_III_AF) [Ruminiclostridium cellobioparum subsp. termitidis CT1112]
MLEFLRSWIINIVTISLILILFEIIVPSGKIKKIITLVSGFVLLIAVVNPFLQLKNSNFDLSEAVQADSFYIDQKEVENSSKLLEETQARQIAEVYKKKLALRIEEEAGKLEGVSVTKTTVEINEDYNSEKFGEITKISVELKKTSKEKDKKTIEPVVTVEKIDINAGLNKKKEKEKEGLKFVDPEDKRLAELVKQNLNKSLEVNKESIEVTIT